MAEPFVLSKAVDMSRAALGKSTSIVAKGLLVLGAIGLVIWMGYVTLVKPHTNPNPTQTLNAQTIQMNYIYPNKKGFSLLSWGTWHFISKDIREVDPIIKENIVPKPVIEKK